MSTTADSLELGGSGEHSIRQGTDQLLVAFEKSDGTYHLGTHHLPGNAEAKIEGLKSWHNNVLERRKRMRAFLMCKTAYIAVGTLGACSDLEAQHSRETQFESLARNETLTRGFARPSSLRHSADIFPRLPCFQATPCDGGSNATARHALVVALEVDKCRVAVSILLIASLGFVIGCTVAAATHDVNLGAGIGGIFFGSVALLQEAVALALK